MKISKRSDEGNERKISEISNHYSYVMLKCKRWWARPVSVKPGQATIKPNEYGENEKINTFSYYFALINEETGRNLVKPGKASEKRDLMEEEDIEERYVTK